MKLLLCLAVLVAVASCLPSPLQQQQQIQSVFQFNEMINCATDEWFLTAVWSYNGYGCYCGLGGEGDPVDETDKCCQVHDACYDAASENGCFALDKYLVEYKYSAWRSNPFKPSTCEIKCTPEDDYYFWEFNEDCKAYMCECDKQGALCFARTADTWDKKYQGWSQSNCK